jgi:hypothetical protein
VRRAEPGNLAEEDKHTREKLLALDLKPFGFAELGLVCRNWFENCVRGISG